MLPSAPAVTEATLAGPYDFTGSGTILLQSSEQMRDDPAVLRLVEQQTQQLSPTETVQLAATLQARAQQR